jgi:hypothetical protein
VVVLRPSPFPFFRRRCLFCAAAIASQRADQSVYMELFLVNRGPLTSSTAIHVRLKRVLLQPRARWKMKTRNRSSLTLTWDRGARPWIYIIHSDEHHQKMHLISVAAGWGVECVRGWLWHFARLEQTIFCTEAKKYMLKSCLRLFIFPTALCLAFLQGADVTCLSFLPRLFKATNKLIKNGTGSFLKTLLWTRVMIVMQVSGAHKGLL